eukprot:Filipodium_phascolosomae@DN491_c0_g1_i1.p1
MEADISIKGQKKNLPHTAVKWMLVEFLRFSKRDGERIEHLQSGIKTFSKMLDYFDRDVANLGAISRTEMAKSLRSVGEDWPQALQLTRVCGGRKNTEHDKRLVELLRERIEETFKGEEIWNLRAVFS